MRFDNKQLTIISPLSLIQKSNPDDLFEGVFIIMNSKGLITKNQTCIQCGKIFNGERSGMKFCSKECHYNSNRGKKLKMNEKEFKHIPLRNELNFSKTKCIICNTEFEYRNNRNAKYCSSECWKNRTEKRKYNCLFCGKECTTNSKDIKKYCSNECYHNDLSKRLSGDKSHFYKHGKSLENQNDRLKYSRELTKWRKGVFKRDNYTCIKCNSKSNIQAHHIKEWSKCIELRFKLSNGITLCHECHQKEHNRKFVLPFKSALNRFEIYERQVEDIKEFGYAKTKINAQNPVLF